jgi:hypothetical protein
VREVKDTTGMVTFPRGGGAVGGSREKGLQPGLDLLISDHLSRQYSGSHPEPWWEIGETHIVQWYIVRIARIVA